MSSGLPASPEAPARPGNRQPVKLWFDGGCRPNPGAMETAVVARGRAWCRQGLGDGDCNDAEWLALLHALEVARELGAEDIILIGDSAMVVQQASGRLRCREPRFGARLAEFRTLAALFRRVRIRHTPRSRNLAGIALERLHGKL